MAAQIPYLDPTAVANDITLLLPVIKMIGGLIPGVAGNSIVALIAGLLAMLMAPLGAGEVRISQVAKA